MSNNNNFPGPAKYTPINRNKNLTGFVIFGKSDKFPILRSFSIFTPGHSDYSHAFHCKSNLNQPKYSYFKKIFKIATKIPFV